MGSKSKNTNESQGMGRPPCARALLFLPEERRPRREDEDGPGLEEEDEEEVESALHALASSEENPWARMRRTAGLVILLCRIGGFIFLERMDALCLWGESEAGARKERSTKRYRKAALCVCA